MVKFKVKEEAYIKYQMTTWQGTVEINGVDVQFRYSEDDNGDEFYTWDGNSWEQADFSNQSHKDIYNAVITYGNPEEFGTVGEIVEIDDETLEDYI